MPIPFVPTCQAFLANLDEQGVAYKITIGDVRLGLEQLLDDQDFRAELTFRWAEPDPSAIELGPDDSFQKFQSVSERHAALTIEQIKTATTAIVDTPEFKQQAEARWARYDAAPWPLVVQDLAGIDDAA